MSGIHSRHPVASRGGDSGLSSGPETGTRPCAHAMATHDTATAGHNGTPPVHRAIPHGTRCDCRLLAEALGMAPVSISYDYCRNVLQKRWVMTCRHGDLRPVETHTCEHGWTSDTPINAVDAILLRNG